MTDLKIYGANLIALFVSVTSIEPLLQIVSLLLAIVYTTINIYKKLGE